MREFRINSEVVLLSFLGLKKTPGDVRDGDDYWRLIGKKSVILMGEEDAGVIRHVRGERVLVKFFDDIHALGLNSHNNLENSLWIFISDLGQCNGQTEE